MCNDEFLNLFSIIKIRILRTVLRSKFLIMLLFCYKILNFHFSSAKL